MRQLVLVTIAVCLTLQTSVLWAQPVEKRIGLVIGNAAYQTGALATPANDAGLVAQTLQAAGFDVVGARDLDEESLRHAVRDFVEKATAAGPEAVVFVYFAGYGLQLEGENYLVPIDAKIERDTDVPVRGLRVYDFVVRTLAATHPKASFVILDAARTSPFAQSGQPLAGGLALMEPPPGMLIAFNAAPGTVAPDGQGPYGPYAQALAEMMREGGLPVGEMFDRIRLRVSEVTKGAQVPWSASNGQPPFVFFERTADAPPPAASADQVATIRSRPIREMAPQEAYAAVLDRDTIGAYEEFIDAYPDDVLARRARAILAIRREAIVWRRTCVVDTPNAYWSYLRRYPNGPHIYDARRRLARFAVALGTPAGFPSNCLRHAAPTARRDRVRRSPGAGVRRSCFSFASSSAAAHLSPSATSARIHRPAATAAADRPLRFAYAGLQAGSGMGATARLCGSAASKQRHLRQYSQHRCYQPGGQRREYYDAKRAASCPTGGPAHAWAQHPTARASPNRRHSRSDRPVPAAVRRPKGFADPRSARSRTDRAGTSAARNQSGTYRPRSATTRAKRAWATRSSIHFAAAATGGWRSRTSAFEVGGARTTEPGRNAARTECKARTRTTSAAIGVCSSGPNGSVRRQPRSTGSTALGSTATSDSGCCAGTLKQEPGCQAAAGTAALPAAGRASKGNACSQAAAASSASSRPASTSDASS